MTNKIIFLSDTHILAAKDARLFDCNTLERLNFVIQNMLENDADVKAIILMGDISQDGSALAYQHLISELKIFPCPIYSIPGNHDDIETMEKVFSASDIFTEKHFKLCGWNFLALNTVKKGDNSGWMTAGELHWLDEKLIELSDQKVILLMHHHALTISTPLIDKFILKNAEEFLNIIKDATNIQLVVFGHVHNVSEMVLNNILFLSCPATCYQIPTGARELTLNKEAVGYRWLELDGDKLLSGVKMFEITGKLIR